ncbi:MAG TPA: hypothetical protein VF507_09165 [Pyrinomonadaceae bacterium]|jgi:hypothetical protein
MFNSHGFSWRSKRRWRCSLLGLVAWFRILQDGLRAQSRRRRVNLARRLLLSVLTLALLLSCAACDRAHVAQNTKAAPVGNSPKGDNASAAPYGSPVVLGRLEDGEITESSGVVASRVDPIIYWTHNDSGGGPFLFAFDGAGKRRGVWRVAGASNVDWEDIAAGPGPQNGRSYLYVGDTGDNGREREQVVVYRLPEPTVTAADAQTRKRSARQTEAAEAIRLRYPDGRHDAETLLVHPKTGDLYVITKNPLRNPGVYKAVAPLRTSGVTTLVKVASLSVPNLMGGALTGGDISPDGRRVAICDYMQGYEVELPAGADSFDAIWKQPLKIVQLGSRLQGEALCYSLDGRSLLATSEGEHSPLIEVPRK